MFDFLLHIITIAGIYALVALSLNIQAGYAGLLNFGHIAFVGIGAYAAGIGAQLGIPFVLSGAIGIGLAMLSGAGMAVLGRQLAADYWGIATLAVAEIIRIVIINENELTGGAQGIGNIAAPWSSGSQQSDSIIFAIVILLVLLLVTLLSLQIGKSRFGRALRLMREQPQLATCMGYHLQWLKCQTLMCSAAIGALAGILLAWYTSYVSPDYLLSSETFLIWSMVMIGGIGNVAGVLIGVLVVESLYNFIPFAKDMFHISSDITGALRLGMVGVILLGCLLGRAGGLLPERLRIIP
ncbi:branched-chain amino acid ABC transporter permease [Pectobacteriaceae bacterium CE70]|uniref:Branched-chain amino acid ABC transporter permease n=1 Tax=Serratia sp. (strain ATCC 39006) TaxID=104623 RepID=A0A2I5TQ07_SERS3|nr:MULTISPECIES: branched-chain amino acid ABC transporter permease [Enterobacterales]WJV58753.1 branched-chain amino acid ABC transporter permease [Pectobacteriaceae bacterium C111]WJV63068.1 branched-chain amino acid ABC transporter permease [Pectobacteriaceae bacterium C52]WJV67390.1 branched-chain amino acid ABC transporter permease [Pectobacteriaceae bacterium CE70]WJY11371.1 branched-chain amino acid ABC transporter permease [Pectobacteriaceae bacterium C80]WJY14573.1 branched-chain amin